MTSNQNETAYADRVVREAMLAATGGLDPDRVAQAVTDIVEAIAKQADGVFRLVEFASGRPDNRPDKATDWLRGLTDEQLRIVQGWVEASAEAAAPPGCGNARNADDGVGGARGPDETGRASVCADGC